MICCLCRVIKSYFKQQSKDVHSPQQEILQVFEEVFEDAEKINNNPTFRVQ